MPVWLPVRGVGEVDHGEAHLKAQQFAAGLDAHEQKIDGHAQDQAQHQLAQKHEGHIERVLRHGRLHRQVGPYSQRKNNGYGCLDLYGDVVGGKDGQHEDHNAHAHDGKQQAKHVCRVVAEDVHAWRFAKKLPKLEEGQRA